MITGTGALASAGVVSIMSMFSRGTSLTSLLSGSGLGLTAGTYQHEVDHLQGKLFVDRVTDTTTLATWADFERYHMPAFVERAKALVAKYGS